MAVPAQGRAQREGGRARRGAFGVRRDLVLEVLQVRGDRPAERLPHRLGGFRPDALDRFEGSGPDPLPHLAFAHSGEGCGRRPEGLYPVGRCLPALQQEGDPLQSRDRIHRRTSWFQCDGPVPV